MRNLRITTRTLTDGSVVHQVRFTTLHSDSTNVTVTLEAYDRKAAARLFDALNEDVAWAESNPS